jgi:RNA polymerase sigma-70 factor, ECF subfamily
MVKEHWSGVYCLMYRLCGNVHDAEELTQDVFLRAMEKWEQFQAGTNLRAWLARIGTNAFLDRKRRKRALSLEEAGGPMGAAGIEPAAPEGEGGAAVVEQGELAEQLHRAMKKLTEMQRAVFLLRTTEDMTFGEIAQVIGTTEATARWHMLQARQQLVRLLEGKL